MKKRAAMAAALLVMMPISACASKETTGINKQANQGDNKNYIAGDGTVEELKPVERGKPVTVSGTLLSGKPWNISSARGKVVVLNVWGAWCGPCQGEMPQIQAAWKSYENANKPVVFMGVDQRDSNVVASSTLSARGVTYPSLANDDGASLQELQDKVTATPTTLIIDKQGRIAGRVLGATTKITVQNMVDKVLSEG